MSDYLVREEDGTSKILREEGGGDALILEEVSDLSISDPYGPVTAGSPAPGTDPGGSTPSGGSEAANLRVSISGNDVTSCAIAGSWTHRLNRPAQATITTPMDCPAYDVGDTLKIEWDVGFGFEIAFHGMILNVECDTAEDGGTTQYNAMDPMELWSWRPVRADDGDLSVPAGSGATDGTDIFATYVNGSEILMAILRNSEGDTTAQGNALLTDNDHREGPTFLTFSSMATGGTDITGAPVDWPMTIMDLWSIMCSTGTVDAVITPTDPGGGILGNLDTYNGDFGSDLSGSVVFSYGTGAYNVSQVRWNRDGTNMVNKYWLFGGPRIATASDPSSLQHWCFNVTADDPLLDDPPLTDILTRRSAAQSAYGIRMKIDIFDGYDDSCGEVAQSSRALYRRLWEEYSYIAAIPRELIHITPTRNTGLGAFHIGDIIGVEATSEVRGGFSGAQRVYQYTVSWDTESVLSLEEIQTSADGEF